MAFSLGQGVGLIQMLIVIGMLVAVSVIALESLATSMGAGEGEGNCAYENRTDCPEGANATYEAVGGVSNFSQQLGNIGLIGAMAVLLGIVMVGFITKTD